MDVTRLLIDNWFKYIFFVKLKNETILIQSALHTIPFHLNLLQILKILVLF